MADLFQTGVDTSPGRLLVAHPRLSAGLFSRSVVLIAEHTPAGHRGFILNKRTDMTLRDIARQHQFDLPIDRTLYQAGPLHAHALTLLHSDEWYSSNTYPVAGQFHLSSDHLMMEKMQLGDVPRHLRALAGWSGWKQGQLEQEIARGDWLTCPADPKLVWETDSDKQWESAVALCSQIMVNSYF
jgi:putative transcriptional regulator